jgi:hypothetical protein
MKIYNLLLCILFNLISIVSYANKNSFKWKEGDILFQNGDCGDFCDAIRKVTNGYNGRDFSHNGILIKENQQWYVLEAISKGVSKTPLEIFLNRKLTKEGKPEVIVGRVNKKYKYLIPDALKFAKKQINKPYDYAFSFENEAFYCSELIHFAFKSANNGKDLFDPKPMTYKDPDTEEYFGIWISYFEKLNIPIPEEQLGLNPGGMSLSPIIRIVKELDK